jgi:hypothetical protein
MLKKGTTMRAALVALCLAYAGGTMSAPTWAEDKPVDKSGYSTGRQQMPKTTGQKHRRVGPSRSKPGPVARPRRPRMVKAARHAARNGRLVENDGCAGQEQIAPSSARQRRARLPPHCISLNFPTDTEAVECTLGWRQDTDL